MSCTCQGCFDKRLGRKTTRGCRKKFSSIVFPVVRRVFGGLITNELVKIQPMTTPVGSIFYLDYTYRKNDDKNED